MVHIIVVQQSANLSTILSAIIRIYSLQIMARRGLPSEAGGKKSQSVPATEENLKFQMRH